MIPASMQQLRTFVAVAEERSFTAAAPTLPVDAVWPRHRGPSAVSDFVDAAAGLRS